MGVDKIAVFDRSRSLLLKRFTAENVCPSATVVRVHDDELAEEYAMSSATLVVDLFITRTLVVQSWDKISTFN